MEKLYYDTRYGIETKKQREMRNKNTTYSLLLGTGFFLFVVLNVFIFFVFIFNVAHSADPSTLLVRTPSGNDTYNQITYTYNEENGQNDAYCVDENYRVLSIYFDATQDTTFNEYLIPANQYNNLNFTITGDQAVYYANIQCVWNSDPTPTQGWYDFEKNGKYYIYGYGQEVNFVDGEYLLLYTLSPTPPNGGGGGYLGNTSPLIASVAGGVGGTLGSIFPIIAVIIGLMLALYFVGWIANDLFGQAIKENKKDKELYIKADKVHKDFKRITKK